MLLFWAVETGVTPGVSVSSCVKFLPFRGRSLTAFSGITVPSSLVEAVNDLPLNGRNFTQDRKSTRLNSSHGYSSYAVFCLKKKSLQPPSPPLSKPHHRPHRCLRPRPARHHLPLLRPPPRQYHLQNRSPRRITPHHRRPTLR